MRASSRLDAEVFASPAMMVWAEGDNRSPLSRLVADPHAGVWGGQDGELFHFMVRDDHTFGRITYGRPHAAAVSAGDLVWLSETQLVGRVWTLHLVRKAADGKVTDVADGRSPAGAPFDLLDVLEGKLHVHDRLGNWYEVSEDGKGFRPVPEVSAARPKAPLGGVDSEQEAMEHAAGGQVQAFMVFLPDRSTYALVQREQLFRFDTAGRKFQLLGQPGLEPVGSVSGQLVARSAGGLVVLDGEGRKVRESPLNPEGLPVYQGRDGWFYNLPFQAVNAVTGEEHRFDPPYVLYGGVTALLPSGDGAMVGGTGHGGAIFRFEPQTGNVVSWGRPIPELGQESGEEVAPVDGLAMGSDGFLYAAVGTGAQGRPESWLVRLDGSGRVLEKTRLSEPLHGLVAGADGRIYGSGYARVVVLPTGGQVR